MAKRRCCQKYFVNKLLKRPTRRYCNPSRLPPGYDTCKDAKRAGYCTRCDKHGFSPHLHFEIKNKGVLGDPESEEQFGYTKDPPDWFGYQDPMLLLHPEVQVMDPTAVTIQDTIKEGLNVRPSPGRYDKAQNTLVPGTKIVAFRQAANDSGVWYQIHLAVPKRNPKKEDNVIEGWVAADFVDVDNAMKVRVKDGISKAVPVYKKRGKKKIGRTWSQQEFVVDLDSQGKKGCKKKWYKVFLGNIHLGNKYIQKGWICGDFVEEVP